MELQEALNELATLCQRHDLSMGFHSDRLVIRDNGRNTQRTFYTEEDAVDSLNETYLHPPIEGENPTYDEFVEWIGRTGVGPALIYPDGSGRLYDENEAGHLTQQGPPFVGPEDARDKFNRIIEGRRRG